MRILGCDPGTNNFGYTLLRVTKGAFKVMKTGILLRPIKDLTGKDFAVHLFAFTSEIQTLSKGANFVAAERFQTRGPKGKTIECVSVMLGVIASLHPKTTVLFVASQWKNSFNREYKTRKRLMPLDKVYAWAKLHKMPNHIVDSCLIAIYQFGNNSFKGVAWEALPISDLFKVWVKANPSKVKNGKKGNRVSVSKPPRAKKRRKRVQRTTV